jgi:glycine/D-amino acid oxidase-like deaminating enzyme
MPKPRYGVPSWLDRFPAARRPDLPRHRGHLDTDVAIVGGGLTGCAAAWAFASAGVPVALFEAGRVGRGLGAVRGLGLLAQEPDADFQQVEAAYGRRAARHVWRETRRASLDFAAALRRLGIGCDLDSSDAIWFTRTPDHLKRVQKELKARRDAGVTQDGASWLNAAALRRETALAGLGGLKTRGVGALDPYRATVGLARAAGAKGAALFERSPALRVRAGRKAVEIRTAGGTVRAGRVVLATGYPTADFRALHRHFAPTHTYVVLTEPMPAAMRRETGRRAAALRDTAAPPHLLRWMREDRILYAGADQPAVPDRSRPRAVVQRAGQLMYELSTHYPDISGLMPAWAWDAAVAATRDGLPFFGPHRNYPRHLFALGHGHHGAGLAFLAARLLVRAHLDAPEKGDELFAFSRMG